MDVVADVHYSHDTADGTIADHLHIDVVAVAVEDFARNIQPAGMAMFEPRPDRRRDGKGRAIGGGNCPLGPWWLDDVSNARVRFWNLHVEMGDQGERKRLLFVAENEVKVNCMNRNPCQPISVSFLST